ncbi:TetR/AcrR family transcriptional regulator [Phenylobacterium sp.]|jgi:AcrR family transcriptional regulator|uniref:TetR/AcrR family transcriptional regulator n=1 Tax=Phenylobacterium sp. TaxID=1871053 RepID=UPI002F42E11A
MPRISAERMQDREDSLLAAAREVFACKGYEAAAVSDVARVAGVSDGLVYRYFGSKRDLLLAVLDSFYSRIIDDLERAVSLSASFEQRVATLVHKHVERFVDDMALCRLFIVEVRNFDEYVGSETHELNRRYTSILMRILADGRAEGRVAGDIDDRLVRDMMFGGIEHVAWRHILAGHPIDVERVAGQITRLLLGGISTSRAS